MALRRLPSDDELELIWKQGLPMASSTLSVTVRSSRSMSANMASVDIRTSGMMGLFNATSSFLGTGIGIPSLSSRVLMAPLSFRRNYAWRSAW